MSYIEKIDTTSECINNCNCSCCNGNSNNPPIPSFNLDDTDNLKRWNNILKGWESKTFEEKMEIFNPKVIYLHARDYSYGEETNDKINKEINHISFSECRTISQIKFNVDRIGYPNTMIILNPIDVNVIPVELKNTIISWGKKYGLI